MARKPKIEDVVEKNENQKKLTNILKFIIILFKE